MNHIPQELRDLPQWVSFTYGPQLDPKTGKPIKRPLISGTNLLASPTDPDHWCTFEEAAAHGHPAFALTANDPYVFIDFDKLSAKPKESPESLEKRQAEALAIWEGVANTFVSYMERSVSGEGVHIIGRGTLLGKGTQRKDVGFELYDRGRFVIFTGDVILDAPISEFPMDELMLFEKWMKGDSFDEEQQVNDQGILIDADDAVHAEEKPDQIPDDVVFRKATKLDWAIGLMTTGYRELGDYGFPSQSDADFAVIAELFRACFNTAQCKRIFNSSVLFRSEKVWDYVERATLRVKKERRKIKREMDRLHASVVIPKKEQPAKPAPTKPITPKLKIEKVQPEAEHVLVSPVSEEPLEGDYLEDERDSFRKLVEDLPPGLLRDITDAFYHYGHYPLFEGALAGALNMAHIIFSRSFQTSTGLALKGWLILVGPTTSGKEIATIGPQGLLKATGIPSVHQLFRGEPRSEQGVFKNLIDTPRFVYHVDECAAWMKTMCDPRAPTCSAQLREALTKLFGKGDRDGVFYSTNRSEKAEKEFIERPCISIFGDSQDANIYAGLTADQIGTGFLPRFLFMDIDTDNVAMESQDATPFPAMLVDLVKKALMHTGRAEAENQPPVKVAIEPAAYAMWKAYELQKRKRIFGKDGQAADDVFRNMHSRSAAKVAIYAAVLAVCYNWQKPKVTKAHLEWARRFVDLCTNNTIAQLSSGEFSADIAQQRKSVERALQTALDMSEDERWANHYFASSPELCGTPHALPLSWLKNRITRLKCFENDRRGAVIALNGVLADLQEDGLWTVIKKEEAFTLFKARCPVICQLTEDYWQARTDNPEDE